MGCRKKHNVRILGGDGLVSDSCQNRITKHHLLKDVSETKSPLKSCPCMPAETTQQRSPVTAFSVLMWAYYGMSETDQCKGVTVLMTHIPMDI